jgi:rSAM/selenodomain-associated transferase 2
MPSALRCGDRCASDRSVKWAVQICDFFKKSQILHSQVDQPLMSTPDRSISIIIPALNEARNLPRTLSVLQTISSVEVIVVDGGSLDDTVSVAETWGTKVLCSPVSGRAHQMNLGAAMAQGNILLFLHADTCLPDGFDDLVRQTLMQPTVVAGAFELAIDGNTPGLRWVEWGVQVRSHLCQMPYGDQALFMTAETFWAIGGFPALPIMEDFALVQQLKQRGRIAIAPGTVITSGRRWQRLNVFRTTVINQLVIIGYLLGVSPVRLAHWYRYRPRRF